MGSTIDGVSNVMALELAVITPSGKGANATVPATRTPNA
jgi:hypothetical protein